ncbi:MAG: hypothetical protein DMG40_21655 [Acidobacteria bacterium]|nr:MAG: hypothetical protein DMG40_21655 [Acidobacteriota bacterium]
MRRDQPGLPSKGEDTPVGFVLATAWLGWLGRFAQVGRCARESAPKQASAQKSGSKAAAVQKGALKMRLALQGCWRATKN